MSSKKKGDANDYSRFDSIDDADVDVPEVKAGKGPKSLADCMAAALRLKDKGNEQFKANDCPAAKISYEDGLEALADHREAKALEALPAASSAELTAMLITLYNNLSMVSVKQENWYKAISYANHTLKLDALSVKALYRRGLAHARIGDIDEAKADLSKCLQLEPTNTAAKKELVDLARSSKEVSARQKTSFGGIFQKGSVYADKAKTAEAKAKQAEEALAKEKEDWIASNERRAAEGLEEQTMGEWRAANTVSDSDSDDEPASATAPTAPAPMPTPSVPRPIRKPSEDEYDEEDAKILAETKAKGYCYFRNEPGHHAPTDFTPQPVTAPAAAPAAKAAVADGSVWNTAGTWEERDMSEYFKQRLQTLKEHVKEVTATGDAQIVIARGKKRHLYDFSVDLLVQIGSHEGHLVYDVSAGSELDYSLKWSKGAGSAEDVAVLHGKVVDKIKGIVEEYCNM